MNSVVEHEPLLFFGFATLPNNFMLFDYSKQKTWFETVKKFASKKDNEQEFLGISLSKQQALNVNDKFIELFKKYFPKTLLVIDVTNTGLFDKKEFVKIAKIKEKLNGICDFKFSENFSYYSFDDVCKANGKLNSWADEINNLKIDGKELSPLEKFYVAYSYVTKYNYNESAIDAYNSRNLIQVLNGENIVCVGYAQMLKSLCNKIGIECEVQKIGFDNPELNHMNCNVTIKDPKYGIDGTFYSDPCFDSNFRGKTSISHALISYSDVPKLFASHWVQFDDEKTYNPDNEIDAGPSIEQSKKEINEFLYSQREHFSKFIDQSLEGRKNHILTKSPSKKELHGIIDKLIEEFLIKIEYGNIKSHFDSFDSELLTKIDMEDLSEMILNHTKIKNIESFKNLLFEEMKTYIPSFDSTAFNRLADAFTRYNTANNNNKLEESKSNTTDLTFENFDKLIHNLKKVEGQSEAFDKKNVDVMVMLSVLRANQIWGEFRNSKNVISILSDLYLKRINETGGERVKSSEELFEIGRKYVQKIKDEQSKQNQVPTNDNGNEKT